MIFFEWFFEGMTRKDKSVDEMMLGWVCPGMKREEGVDEWDFYFPIID